ncbi:MAG: glycosyltransferase [Halobacteriota archaeon]|nr:glycosyltransferase [Halobacteriota archaeon]
MIKSKSVSIIIPFKEYNDYVKECIEGCKRLNYPDFEIILLPDGQIGDIDGVRIIPTGAVTPGRKRNIGVMHAKGEYCAFIDDDAYPREDWLKNAMKSFSDPQIAATGGPGLTPLSDNLMQNASGYILSSFMVGGLSSRYGEKKVKISDDIHSCNFITRRSVVEEVFWDEKYWPGEDTLMCRGINGLGKKMLEDPNVVIYHHRRPLFVPHLRQLSRFGMHRGFFAKKFPENSMKLTYFIPSLLVLFLVAGSILSLLFPSLRLVFLGSILMYIGLAFVSASLSRDIKMILPVWFGTMLTHLTYGVFFLVGLFKKELVR